jgi:hypothetical protein
MCQKPLLKSICFPCLRLIAWTSKTTGRLTAIPVPRPHSLLLNHQALAPTQPIPCAPLHPSPQLCLCRVPCGHKPSSSSMGEASIIVQRSTAFQLTIRRWNVFVSAAHSWPINLTSQIRFADKQHFMFREILGKYPPVLAEVMADDVPGETKTCLDIGCGSGGW